MSPYATDDDEPWPGVLDTVPDVFQERVKEPAFSDEFGTPYVAVCLRREHGDTAWRHGDIDFPGGEDGADWMFALLTADVVTALSPGTTLAAVTDDVVATGYPI